jgi:hypothetical protein
LATIWTNLLNMTSKRVLEWGWNGLKKNDDEEKAVPFWHYCYTKRINFCYDFWKLKFSPKEKEQ